MLKASIVGLGGVLIVVMTTTTAMIGLRRMHAVALEAQPDSRYATAFAPTPRRLAWITPPAGAMAARPLVMAGLPAPETMGAIEAQSAPGSLDSDPQGLQDEPATDQVYTGSIAAYLPTIALPEVASVALSAGLPPGDDAPLLPLPRARPRLAALPPFGDLGIKPEEDARTAIYDITARTVYLPNGERLEAHSGLGNLMDDPRHVRAKNRGATPPNTYKLTLRESLFHGVRAIRLTPASDGNMFGRDGILAHSYLLGPSGQSNGCISFKDYPKFLRAYLRGEIDRIVVVPQITKAPTYFARSNVRSASSTY